MTFPQIQIADSDWERMMALLQDYNAKVQTQGRFKSGNLAESCWYVFKKELINEN